MTFSPAFSNGFFSLAGRLCSGAEGLVLTEQMCFLPLSSYCEVVTRILIFCGYCFWST